MKWKNYLAEISRTIRPGGKCLITYFILNESSLKCILDQKSTFQFKHQYQGCFIDQVDVPEAAVGYEEEKIKSLFAKYSFILDSIHYGNWCGRKEYKFQDIIILKKEGFLVNSFDLHNMDGMDYKYPRFRKFAKKICPDHMVDYIR